MPRIERARPLLGTRVAIRVEGLAQADANRAIDEAFDEIARVHRLMSFHEPGSDLSALNRNACDGAVAVDPWTYEVLASALEFAEASRGCFDVTVAPALVARGALPHPGGGRAPDAQADWRDVELGEDWHVRFHRPLWIDLGGIAKGYAVDRAVEKLWTLGAVQACVNAGGDLRVCGPAVERVLLQIEEPSGAAVPVLEIAQAAVASSSGQIEGREHSRNILALHIDGRTRETMPAARFVSVVAERCIVADALTKIVLGLEDRSAPILARYGAMAHLHDGRHGWRHVGVA